jgi:protein-tyrosine-phosphatase
MKIMTYKPKVLFLDLENCAGSQMAEAYLRYLGGDLFEAFSAAIEPQELSAIADLVMDEVEIDISNRYCKNVEEYLTFHFKCVIALCELGPDGLPVFRCAERFLRWDFLDTDGTRDSSHESLGVFRRFRNQIEDRVLGFISAYSLSSSGETTPIVLNKCVVGPNGSRIEAGAVQKIAVSILRDAACT